MIARLAIFGLAAALNAAPCDTARASSAPLPANRLPEAFLAACEAAAPSYGGYERAIAEGAAALIAIGALSGDDFAAARIGFCPLRAEGGPFGVTACGEDVILLDDKYRKGKDALVLSATLAHEMKHVLQHRGRRAARGRAWCDSADYASERDALEAEADAFGDGAAALVALGRPVEIASACDRPLTVYVEAEDAVAVAGAEPLFLSIPARGAAIAADRARSPGALYFAESAPPAPGAGARGGGQTRIVEGRLIRLRPARLAAPPRLDGRFRLTLSCAGEAVEKAEP